jgi:hypothetical protein
MNTATGIVVPGLAARLEAQGIIALGPRIWAVVDPRI